MDISNRLKEICKMIEPCDKIIDVGTDHCLIPIFLLKNKVCNFAIGSDINKGPLNKAKINVEEWGLSDRISIRLGGGFSVISPKEVNGAVIAGMGGNLIRDIIEEDLEVFKFLDFAVLQPVQNPEVLRKYINGKGFKILDENICFEDNKYYEIIKIKYDDKVELTDEIYFEVSQNLINSNNDLVEGFIKWKIQNYTNIYNNIDKDTLAARKRKSEVKSKIVKLKEMLRIYENE